MPLPTTDEARTYTFRCFHSTTCRPLDDHHGPECQLANDGAREAFYADLVAEEFGRDVLREVRIIETFNRVATR